MQEELAKEPDSKERNIYLDVLRAFAIILVIVGHSIQYGSGKGYNGFFYNPVFIFIYIFHMPLFMLISGYLFAFSCKKKSGKELVINKCKQLLIPLLAWSFVTLIISMIKIATGVISQKITIIWIFQSIIDGFRGGPWFLWAIWWCSLVIILGKSFLKDNLIFYIALCIISFVIPDNVIAAVYKFMWPFFLSGYMFNKYNLKEKLKNIYLNWICIASCFIIFAILLHFYNYNTFIYTWGFYILDKYTLMYIDNNLLRFIIGVFGSVSMMYLVYFMLKITPSCIKHALAYIGKSTIGIYIISNYLFYDVLSSIPVPGLNYFYILIESICILAISLFVTFILQRFKITNRLFLGGR